MDAQASRSKASSIKSGVHTPSNTQCSVKDIRKQDTKVNPQRGLAIYRRHLQGHVDLGELSSERVNQILLIVVQFDLI